MSTNRKTTWEVIGTGAETRIHEVPGNNGKTYEDAKKEAIDRLEEIVRPYVTRLIGLGTDIFREQGRLPELKVCVSNTRLVSAKTKIRAVELLGCSRYDFDQGFCGAAPQDDWWYTFAREEGAWVRRRDKNGMRTGEYTELPRREDIDTLLDAALADYMRMPFTLLEPLEGERQTIERCRGKAYLITITVERWDERTFHVAAEIDSVWPMIKSIWRHPDEELGASPALAEEVGHD